MRVPDLRQAAAGEGRLAGEALEEDAAERVDVARLSRFEALDQLGREVVRGAEDLTLAGEAGRVGGAREAEVGQGGGTVVVEEHVRGLHVAMEHAPVVQLVEPPAELRRELDRFVDLQAPPAQQLGKGSAVVVRHREIRHSLRVPELEDRHDVPRIDSARDPRLAGEAGEHDGVRGALGAEQLESNSRAVVARRAEHEARCARSE